MSNTPDIATPANPALPASSQATAIEQSRAVAEVQAAVVVAQQMPRHISTVRSEMQLSCTQVYLAEKAFYRYPRGGQTVSGASIHLARELARCWGNVDYGIKELRRDDIAGESEMLAYAWDQQTNARSSTTFIVPHRRDTRGGGSTLTDLRDIYENNANMGARRLREQIFAVLPPWFTAEAEELCQTTLEKGNGQPLEQRVAGIVTAFAGMGVTAEQLEQKLGRPQERWTAFDVAQLTVTGKSLRRGEVTIADEFPTLRVTSEEITSAVTPAATPVPEVADEPPVDEPEPDDDDGPAGDVTAPQLKAVNALLHQHGHAGPNRWPAIEKIIGRRVSSTKQLTKAEASQLIDALQPEGAPEGGEAA